MKREALASALSVGMAFTPITIQGNDEQSASGTRSAPSTAATLDPVETAMLRREVAAQLSDAETRAQRREKREERRAARKKRKAKFADSTASPKLEAIAACESGGNPKAIGGGGAYRGKYQMATATWASVGGSGDPAAAPEAEQDKRAAMLLAQAGPGQWPVCSR